MSDSSHKHEKAARKAESLHVLPSVRRNRTGGGVWNKATEELPGDIVDESDPDRKDLP